MLQAIPRRTGALPRKTYSLEFVWLLGLILSLAHERPILVLTSMDRVNPRLFDIMVALGILIVLPRLRRAAPLPTEFRIWTLIVTIYVICACIYATFLLPEEYAKFSLFFAAKYIEGWIAIYIALKIPLTPQRKRAIQWAIVTAGVYVGLYSIYQYFSLPDQSMVEIAPGKYVSYFRHVITGPLGYNYFHIAQLSPLCAIVALPLIGTIQGSMKRWMMLGVVGFIAWPIFFSGSRTGLGLLAISLVIGTLLIRGVRTRVVALIVLLGFAFNVVNSAIDIGRLSEATTFARLFEAESGENKFANRIRSTFAFNLNDYEWGTLLPLIGGGFYVAPRTSGSLEKYRVGYGVHNTYLFALEQGGMFALLAFIYFLYVSIAKLYSIAKRGIAVDRSFAIAVLAYLLASLPAYLAGQIFWFGFGTVHFNVLIVLVIMLGVRRAEEERWRSSSPRLPQFAYAR